MTILKESTLLALWCGVSIALLLLVPSLAAAQERPLEVRLETRAEVEAGGHPDAVRVRAEVAQGVREEGQDQYEQESRDGDRPRPMLVERIRLNLAASTTPARSVEELRALIAERRASLEDEAASTTPRDREVVRKANEVRLAVHTLLAARDTLGGIGDRVSVIARQMNDSVATTTNAEAAISRRGFLARLFVGGDRDAAEVLGEEVERNKERAEEIRTLLASSEVDAEVRVELEAQLAAMRAEHERLAALAEEERAARGIFGWLFR